jgi:hypothetical protein
LVHGAWQLWMQNIFCKGLVGLQQEKTDWLA